MRQVSAETLRESLPWRDKQVSRPYRRSFVACIQPEYVYDICWFFCPLELQPIFTAQPSNPFLVLEGKNISLEWSYDLGAGITSISRVEFDLVKSTSTDLIVEVSSVGQTPSLLNSDYKGRLQVNVTTTHTSITILEANRTVDSANYNLKVVRGQDGKRTASPVTISVQCKYHSQFT